MCITLKSTIFVRIIFRCDECLTKRKEINILTVQFGIVRAVSFATVRFCLRAKIMNIERSGILNSC
jgi:hypothetical protein